MGEGHFKELCWQRGKWGSALASGEAAGNGGLGGRASSAWTAQGRPGGFCVIQIGGWSAVESKVAEILSSKGGSTCCSHVRRQKEVEVGI